MALIHLCPEERKVILLSSLGGALEFYDFIIYVFFASTLSHLFFPKANHLAALIGVFAVFAVGYLIRPLGGVIFSHYGDKFGRKKTFTTTLILMALPTFLIGLLPTAEDIGIWAAVFLTLLRILQGLSVGGEIPGAVTFTGEHVNPKHRGLSCAFIFFGINIGMLLGSAVNLILSCALSTESLYGWGWRIPFILGGLLGVVSFYLRKQLSETPVFKLFHDQTRRSAIPVVDAFRFYLPQIIQSIGLASLGAVIVCLLFLYLPTYLSSILHYPKDLINTLNTVNLFVFSTLFILVGWLSDIIGRRVILIFGSACFFFISYGCFFLLSQHEIAYVVIVMLAFSILGACIIGVYPCSIIELFPTRVRYTGLAISYNIAFGVFGGLSPLIATYLIMNTKSDLSPSLYVMICALACFISAMYLKGKNETIALNRSKLVNENQV